MKLDIDKLEGVRRREGARAAAERSILHPAAGGAGRVRCGRKGAYPAGGCSFCYHFVPPPWQSSQSMRSPGQDPTIHAP